MKTQKYNLSTSIAQQAIFIVHAKRGYEYHEKRIIDLFKEKKLNFEFITDGDPSNFTPELIDRYFTEGIENDLSRGVLSCTLNHIFIYEQIVARKLPFALVLENDPFFLKDLREELDIMSEEILNLPSGFIISLENSTLRFPSYWQKKQGKSLYRAIDGRMAGAYLIDFAAAKRILEDLKTTKCHTVIDWWHNSLIDRKVVRMYWAHPAIFEQGSHNGQMSSTISTKPKNRGRQIKWKIQKYYKMLVGRLINSKFLISDSEVENNELNHEAQVAVLEISEELN